MPEVISNTSPIQYLYQAGMIELLPALYGRVVLPEAVVEELSEGRARGVGLPDVDALSWTDVRRPKEKTVLPLVTDLGPGERETLALAVEAPGSLVIVDDGLARKHARLLGVRFTGTLGILLKAKQSGHLEAVGPVLDRLEALGFRLSSETRAAALKLAGELG